ncbi:MAG: hypothetical protein AB7H80_02645 [Candidatus Kapaibacterium sp.]
MSRFYWLWKGKNISVNRFVDVTKRKLRVSRHNLHAIPLCSLTYMVVDVVKEM